MTFRWLIRRLGLGLILVSLILSGTLLVASTQQTSQAFSIYYEVPFVCGTASGSGDLSAGKYYSLVNIVNATDEDIDIKDVVVSTIPESRTSSAVGILSGKIGGALGLTCEAIASRLGFPSSTLITGTVLFGVKEFPDAPDLLVVSSTILETIGSTTLATVVQPMTTSPLLTTPPQPQMLYMPSHEYPVVHALPFICGTASGSGDLPRGEYFSSVNIINATGEDINIDHTIVSTIPGGVNSAIEFLSGIPEASVGLTCEAIASRLGFPSNTLIAGTILVGVKEKPDLDAPELVVATSTILGTIGGRTVVVQPMTTAPLLGSSSS